MSKTRLFVVAGEKFGELSAIRNLPAESGRLTQAEFLCLRCGSVVTRPIKRVKNGHIASCGCLRRKRNNLSRTRVFQAWTGMMARCYREQNRSYKDYGGRGIKVCERWHDFENFFADMGHRPDGLSLDRIDNEGDYMASNCRWATRKEQANNKRGSVYLTHDGVTRTLRQWSEILGVPYNRMQARLAKGWPAGDVLSTAKHRPFGRIKQANVGP